MFQIVAGSGAVVLASAAAVLIALSRHGYDRSLEQNFQQHWGVAVVANDLQSRVTALVTTPTRPVRMRDLNASDESAALALVGKAFAVYPTGFVPRMLKTIALASHIDVWRRDAGGLYRDQMIAVNFEGINDPSTRPFDIDTVHHELSSIVRRQVTFNVTSWESANPAGFSYMSREGYKAVLSDAGAVEGTPALHRLGFISHYGQTSLDNDWNTYAERVFGHGTEFAQWLIAEPALRAKTRILIDVYQSLDPRFGAYFEQTGLSRAVMGEAEAGGPPRPPSST